MNKKQPDRVEFYFWEEKGLLLIVIVTGMVYNLGLAAGPWFEGMMVQYLCDILLHERQAVQMLLLAAGYIVSICFVQCMRYYKRLYVRKFANNVSKRMKSSLFRNMICQKAYEQEEAGDMLSKILSDADACAEGMRKVTTEIFDTGVAMAAYLVMLFYYDWKLTAVCMLFLPIAYVLAERLKGPVTEKVMQSRESNARLNTATLDRIGNALTYRVYGQETNQNKIYETYLADYEKKTIQANVWENVMQPIYQVISMLGTVFIIWFGGKNVLGTGEMVWNVAAFTTFFSCYKKLAVKSSKAAKLFNAIQKAKVSWKRIKPFLHDSEIKQEMEQENQKKMTPLLCVKHLTFAFPKQPPLVRDLSFEAQKGQIIGITGEVACGKSVLGKLFIGEFPYEGQIFMGKEMLCNAGGLAESRVGYLGHQPELFSTTIKENICLGKEGDILPVLRAVCIDKEIEALPQGIHTVIGSDGVSLSGGQQARIALARTLYHQKALMVLDDPFSAVDAETEQNIFTNLRMYAQESIILLISHRLALFPQMDKVLYMENGMVTVSVHEQMLAEKEQYRFLYTMQQKEDI